MATLSAFIAVSLSESMRDTEGNFAISYTFGNVSILNGEY